MAKKPAIAIDLRDGSSLRWVSLLPEGPIHVRGTKWDLAADITDPQNLMFKFDDWVSSLEKWLTVYSPPIAIEHETNGTGAGYMRCIRVMTRDEAALYDIAQPCERMVYAGLEVTSPTWAQRFDDGEVVYISPNIRAGATTEASDEVYLFGIGEVSFVTIPQVKSQQVPVAEMRGVSLSEGVTMKEKLAAYCADMGLDPAKIEELLRLVAAAAEEAPKTEMSVEIEAEKKDEEVAKSAAEMASLKDEVKNLYMANAIQSVRADLAGRRLSDAAMNALAGAFLSDKASYAALLKDMAPASAAVASARTVAPVAAATANLGEVMGKVQAFAALSDDEQYSLIVNLSEKEGCSQIAAWCWIRDGKIPSEVLEQRATKGNH